MSIIHAPGGLLLALFILAAWPQTAAAQVSDYDQPAISIERLWAEPGQGGYVAATDASVLEPGVFSLGFLASLMSRPVVLTDLVTGEEASVPVKLRLGYELSAARGMTERLQLGVALPLIAAQDGDRLQGIGLSEESLAPMAVGDLRLHGKLRLQDDASRAYSYGASFYVALPTGDASSFAGERGTVLGWSLLASYQVGGWRFAGNLGVRLRTAEVILISPARPHGNEFIATVAGEYALPFELAVPLQVLAEISKVEGDDGGPSPGEWRAGLKGRVARRLDLRLVGARGFTPDEVGAPRWRLALLAQYDLR